MGAGSIEERGGRFRVRLRIAGKKQTLGTYPTRDRAEAVLDAALDELEAKRAGLVGAVTLRDWIPRWLEQRHAGQEVRSTEGDASRLRTHVLGELWADDPIESVSRPTVQAWTRILLTRPARRYVGGARLQNSPQLAELGRPLSRTTVGHALRTLRVCFRDALEAGLVDENPCVGVRVPRVERTDDPWTFLKLPELAALLGCKAVPIADRQVFFVAIFTGLRKGELWGLRWGDVSFDGAGHLTVRRSYKRAPKNGKHRKVPMLPAARAALEALRDAAGELATDPAALVFPSRDGGMRRPYDSSGLDAALKLAGLRHVRFHDLRHTCASHLRMGSWQRPLQPSELQLWMGHSSVAMVERYGHFAPDYLLGPTLDPNRSHLRELNPGPTVYETVQKVNDDAALAADGAATGPLFDLAVKVYQAVDAEQPVERLAVELAKRVIAALASSELSPSLSARARVKG